MAIQIPKERYAPLGELYSLQPGEWDALIKVFERVEPSISMPEVLIEVGKKIGKDIPASQDILSILADLAQVKTVSNLSTDRFLDELRMASNSSGDPKLATASVDWDLISRSIGLILDDSSALAQSSKLSGLQWDRPNVFQDARVLTDLRPSFGATPDEGVKQFILIHTLRLQYKDLDGPREFFISLDGDDIRELHREVERSIEKEVALSAFLSNQGFVAFGGKTSEG